MKKFVVTAFVALIIIWAMPMLAEAGIKIGGFFSNGGP